MQFKAYKNKRLAALKSLLRDNFQCDMLSLRYMTDFRIALDMAMILLKMPGISPESTITDVMSSIGGNTIQFGRIFRRVNAIEVHDARRKMLTQNIQLFGLTNVKVFAGFYQNKIDRLKQDCIFFDPPWGLDYKKYFTMRLKLPGPGSKFTPLEQAIERLRACAKYIMVKLPLNYDMDYFEDSISNIGRIVYEMRYGRPNSMQIVVIKFTTK